MMPQLNMKAVYKHSDDVVAREIEGEMIIVPLTAGIGDMEDELYTLNETGKLIWGSLNGVATLTEIVQQLCQTHSGTSTEIEQDVQGFVEELLKRRLLVQLSED